MPAHQERHQVLRRLRVHGHALLLLQVRLQYVRHHVRRDVLLWLLLLAHREVRQLPNRPAVLGAAKPGSTATHAATATTTEVTLGEAQQLCLVRRA